MTDVDLSEFYKLREAKSCVIGRSIESLDESDRVKVIAAMKEPSISGRMIFQFFVSRDFTFAYSSINIHRGGRCHCD